MSSANVTISSGILKEATVPGGGGNALANAAVYQRNDQAMVKLLKTLVAQDRTIASMVTLGGIVTGVVNPAAGVNSTIVTVGFQPAYVKVIQMTTLQQLEFYSGMAAANALLTKGGTSGAGTTLQLLTTEGITPSATGFLGGSSVFPAGARCNYVAMRRLGA